MILNSCDLTDFKYYYGVTFLNSSSIDEEGRRGHFLSLAVCIWDQGCCSKPAWGTLLSTTDLAQQGLELVTPSCLPQKIAGRSEWPQEWEESWFCHPWKRLRLDTVSPWMSSKMACHLLGSSSDLNMWASLSTDTATNCPWGCEAVCALCV